MSLTDTANANYQDINLMTQRPKNQRTTGQQAAEPNPTDLHPPSPCIKVCQLDPDQVCLGCKRTLQEIADWPTLSPQQKQKILNRLASLTTRPT